MGAALFSCRMMGVVIDFVLLRFLLLWILFGRRPGVRFTHAHASHHSLHHALHHVLHHGALPLLHLLDMGANLLLKFSKLRRILRSQSQESAIRDRFIFHGAGHHLALHHRGAWVIRI